MKSSLFLRTASVLTFVHAALHTVGGVFGKPVNALAASTYATMQANTFPAMGMVRSYADFLRGMGLAVSIFLLVESIVLWQLGSIIKTEGARLRPVLATFLVGYVLMSANSYAYFFLAPVFTELLIALCLGAAIAAAGASERTALAASRA